MTPEHAPTGSEIAELPFGEQFLLWALRSWVKTYLNQGDLYATLHKGFRLAGMDEGFPALDELLTVVATSAAANIDVRCPRCAEVSLDEQLFIGLIAALQRANLAVAERLLAYWLPPAGIRLAQDSAARLAGHMADRGLALRPRVIHRDAGAQKAAAARWPQDGRAPASAVLH